MKASSYSSNTEGSDNARDRDQGEAPVDRQPADFHQESNDNGDCNPNSDIPEDAATSQDDNDDGPELPPALEGSLLPLPLSQISAATWNTRALLMHAGAKQKRANAKINAWRDLCS